MSDKKDLVVQEEQVSDLTAQDLKRIEAYVAAGHPGFDLEDTTSASKFMDLYLSGKTYSQIARITRKPKELIMLYSKELKWYDIKTEYMLELQANTKGRVIAAKMESQDFLLQLAQMFQKKIGSKMDAYMNTNNPEHADAISSKEIDSYLKTVKAIHELAENRAGKASDKPLVGLNVGDGATLTKNDDGSIDITPKNKAVGSMLEMLANKRREAEAAKTSDIKEVSTQKDQKGDSGDKK